MGFGNLYYNTGLCPCSWLLTRTIRPYSWRYTHSLKTQRHRKISLRDFSQPLTQWQKGLPDFWRRKVISSVTQQRSLCKYYNSDGILQSEAKEYHKIKAHNKPHTTDLLTGENLYLGRSNRELSRKQGLHKVSLWWSFPGWGLVGFQVQNLDILFCMVGAISGLWDN